MAIGLVIIGSGANVVPLADDVLEETESPVLGRPEVPVFVWVDEAKDPVPSGFELILDAVDATEAFAVAFG